MNGIFNAKWQKNYSCTEFQINEPFTNPLLLFPTVSEKQETESDQTINYSHNKNYS